MSTSSVAPSSESRASSASLVSSGAIAEGIEFIYLTQPVAAVSKGNNFALRCVKTELGQPGADRRRQFGPVKGSEVGPHVDEDRFRSSLVRRAEQHAPERRQDAERARFPVQAVRPAPAQLGFGHGERQVTDHQAKALVETPANDVESEEDKVQSREDTVDVVMVK